jgi:cytochrome c peroxidase
MMRLWLAVGCLLFAVAGAAHADDAPVFDAAQTRRILSFGPWPPAAVPDRSNRLSSRPDAIRLGAVLFAEPRLSGDGTISCQTCHQPQHGWSDARPRSQGLQLHDRNAPGLLNVRLQRWFGWDGAGDSLWAAAIRPILAETEMGGSAAATARLLRDEPSLACLTRQIDPAAATLDDEGLLVLAAKALAAFQETLVSPRTPFDDFRDALAASNGTVMTRYPVAAQRGLALFTGRGQCATCHSGPNFSNGEFHDTGLPFFVADPGQRRVDPGRHGGITRLKASRFNLLGRYNDDPAAPAVIPVRHVTQLHRNWGEFKVPGLRNLTATAPYMHDGSRATLPDVIRHYSELDEDRLHADGEAILKPLHLSATETADLLAFLQSLSAPDDSLARYAALQAEARQACP